MTIDTTIRLTEYEVRKILATHLAEHGYVVNNLQDLKPQLRFRPASDGGTIFEGYSFAIARVEQ